MRVRQRLGSVRGAAAVLLGALGCEGRFVDPASPAGQEQHATGGFAGRAPTTGAGGGVLAPAPRDGGGSGAAAPAAGTGGAAGGATGGTSGQTTGDAGSTTTHDAGAPDGRSPPLDAAIPPPGKPVFVAVGYAGRRVRSLDLGKTWVDDQTLGGGGDDEFLLRAVEWGNGVFVAAGWKIVTSPDGKTWTERKNPQNQWLGGIKYGKSRFGAAGGYGYAAYSLDGLAWTAGSDRQGDAARSVAFGNDTWIAATDSGTWWSSSDGKAWSRTTTGHSSRVVFCGDAFKDASACTGPWGHNEGRVAFGGGVYVSIAGDRIERSEDGVRWTTVASGGPGLESVAVGYVP
jgi:hypothetical protein